MKCARCGGPAVQSTVSEAVELNGGGLLVVRRIPCFKCDTCGEIMYTGDVVERLETITREAEERARELTIIRYAQAS